MTRRQRAEAHRHRAAFEAVLATPEGRQVLLWVLDQCGIYSVTLSGDNQAHVNEGRRQVGLALVRQITEVAPGAYPDMIRAALTRAAALPPNTSTEGEDEQDDL